MSVSDQLWGGEYRSRVEVFCYSFVATQLHKYQYNSLYVFRDYIGASRVPSSDVCLSQNSYGVVSTSLGLRFVATLS